MICIVSDFDNTITLNKDCTGFTTIEKYLGSDFTSFRQNMYQQLEGVDNLNPKAKKELYDKLWQKKYNYLKQAHIDDNILDKVITEVTFKDNFANFLEYLAHNNIRFIINSAGFGDFIKHKLEKENLNFPNVYVVANFLSDTNNYITRVNKNKNPEYLKLVQDYDQFIIIGDDPKDLSMIPDLPGISVTTIAFKKKKNIDYSKYFDYVINAEDFTDVYNIVKSLCKKKGGR